MCVGESLGPRDGLNGLDGPSSESLIEEPDSEIVSTPQKDDPTAEKPFESGTSPSGPPPESQATSENGVEISDMQTAQSH